ncbi:hypothetical protein UFOVP139_55 [uncultured Caudovirales phage]|uniref:Uncharacterized protein n=1 Tax=uncultured Caudovirales phage TaxID=2100421 RepID=A0A6J5LH69_9CAUD|nr:hypothetical protein UFOVP139_55 [uncultured Caudovirales phage]
MSSSNLVSIKAIEEASYGVTPDTGDFSTARFISESLSGTPQTAKSTEIHSDRTSSGQVQVGLDVGGDINSELSADPLQQDFIRAAMMQKAVQAETEITGKAVVIKAIDKTLQFEGSIDLAKGDLIFLNGFAEDKNNGMAYVSSVNATEITAMVPEVPAKAAPKITATPSGDTDYLFTFSVEGGLAGTFFFGESDASAVVGVDETTSYTYGSADTFSVKFVDENGSASHLSLTVVGVFAEETTQTSGAEVAYKEAIIATASTDTDYLFSFAVNNKIAGTFAFGDPDGTTADIDVGGSASFTYAGAGTFDVTFTVNGVVSTLALEVVSIGDGARDQTGDASVPLVPAIPEVPAVNGFLVKVGKETIADETSPTTARITKARKISVGTDIVSFSMCKEYEDLTNKSISYLGMLVNQMTLSLKYGAIADVMFGFMGNGYDTPDEPMTKGRLVRAASTVQPLNATSDIGSVFIDGQIAKFCIQNLTVELNNGLNPQHCMGRLAPRGYALGTASVKVSGSAYLSDENWDLLEKKLTQEPVSIAYTASNQDGGIAVIVHGAQLSFPDASSKGMDQQVSIEFSGSAKNTENGYLDIYFY